MIKVFNLLRASMLVIISSGMLTFIPASLAQVSDKDISSDDIKTAIENVKSNYYMPFDVANIGRVNNSLANGCSITSNLKIKCNDSYSSISGTNIYEYLEALTNISLQSKANGDVLWGRIQGGPYERKASEYVKKTFEIWGFEDVQMQEFPLTSGVWVPSSVDVAVQQGETQVTFKSAATACPSGVTPPGGLRLPVEYVGFGTAAELRGKDLKGKIALLYVRVFDGVLMHSGLASANRIATETNAEGIILWMDLPGNAKHATQLYTPTGWIDSIPWTSIGFEDGAYLRRLIDISDDDSLPVVNLVVEGEFRTVGTSQNVVAMLPGTTDENLIITAHIDGFWEAVLDNGTGVAALMELARYYKNIPQEQRTRNLIFLVTGDHETAGSGGSDFYHNRNPEIIEKTALAIQLEHLGAPGNKNQLNMLVTTNVLAPLLPFISNGNYFVHDAMKRMVNNYGIVVNRDLLTAPAGDVDGLIDIPSAGFIQTGYLYHSEIDSLDWYKPEDLERLTRAHAFLIDEVNKIPIEEIRESSIGDLPPPYSSPDVMELLRVW